MAPQEMGDMGWSLTDKQKDRLKEISDRIEDINDILHNVNMNLYSIEEE